MNNPQKSTIPKGQRWGIGLALLAFLAIAAFFLITEHRAHLYGILPYVLLAAAAGLFLLMRRSQPDRSNRTARPSKEKEK